MKNIFIVSMFLLITSPCFADMVSVAHLPADLRDQPKVSGSKVLRELPKYFPLTVLGSESKYFKVQDNTGLTGFIHQSLVGNDPGVIVSADACNVRSEPSIDAPILFDAKKGDTFHVISFKEGWLEVSGSDGKKGWISQKLTWGYAPK